MLDVSELRMLTAWCSQRGLCWTPARPAAGVAAMVLEPRDSWAPWQRMLLVFDEPDMRLEDEVGETLASASDLLALLDAVDGGVAEPPALHHHALARTGFVPMAAPVAGLGFIA